MIDTFKKTLWATADKLRANMDGHVLTPGRYVGAEEIEDEDEAFADKTRKLTETLGGQMTRGAELDALIRKRLGGV